MNVVILADDLTGAADALVTFAQAGCSSLLTVGGDFPSAVVADAVAFSLDTRSDPHAAEVTERAVRAAAGEALYLKVDSTARGRVAEQVRGALAGRRASRPDSFAVVCPAYPALGRTVVDGWVLVHGHPAHEGPVGADPVTPLLTSDLTRVVPGSAKAGGEDLVAAIRQEAEAHDVVIVDASTDAELARLADAICHLGPDTIPVGSAGLAQALARAWSDGTAASGPRTVHGAAETLVVMSSLHESARAQADVLRGADQAAVGRVEILVTPHARDQRSPTHVADALAREASHRLAQGAFDLLVLVGGDGAAAVLRELGATGIRIEGAAVEGVPTGAVVGGHHDGLPVATKAGGFGDVHTLIDLIRAVRTPQGEAS